MANDFFTVAGVPVTGSQGLSSVVRAEFASIASGFDKMPAITGFPLKAVVVNGAGTALTLTAGALAIAGNFTTTGAFNTTLVVGATVSITLPIVTGLTLATLTGIETFTNKTLTAPAISAPAFSGTATGSLTNLALTTPTLTTPTISAPAFSGTATGTYTLGGTPTGSLVSVLATGSTTARTLATRAADVFNVLDYGAVRDGVTNDATAIQATYDAADASGVPATVFFPSGNYLKSTVTTIYGNNITTFAYGAVVNCNGADGFILDIVDQDNHQFLGMEIYNWLTVGYGIPTTGGANNTLKRWFTVRDCVIRDSVQTNVNVRGIQLSCETYGVKILDNHLSNIITTSTSTGGNSYGIIVGKKADTLAGGRTGELGSYGYDNSDIHTAEGSTIISGNTIRKMRCSGGALTDAITGILADGWRCIVSNNVVEDVQYIGAGVYGGSGVGIYMRGWDNTCTGNSVANCTTSCITIKGDTSVTWGTVTSRTILSNNMLAGLAPLVNTEVGAYGAIQVTTSGHLVVTGNYFSKILCPAGGTGVIMRLSSGSNTEHIIVTNNFFDQCRAVFQCQVAGARMVMTGNVVSRPIAGGPTTPGSDTFRAFYAIAPGSTAINGCVIENNTVFIDETNFAGGTGNCYGVFVEGNLGAIHSLFVKNNKFLGWNGLAPTLGVWTFVTDSINGAGTLVDHVLTGNYTDALWRGVTGGASVSFYTRINVSGAGTRPTRLEQRFDHGFELAVSAASLLTLEQDESGATFSNVGAVAGWSYQLPVSLPGLEFGFRKVVNQAVTVDPNGTEIINAGAAGGILTLTNVGSCVYLKCFVAGTWVVTNSNGAYTVA